MVLCKFFQQGTCRFGQYCKFEHSFGNRSKTFGEDKNIALLVAEDVLHAERGGQWLLSCYGPFKEKKCIPGMDDLSPEEVRWEMYQAQKNGTVDQVNAQFQQMCEAMKAKRDALKNPTPAIVQLLEEIQNSGSENSAFGDSSKLKQGNFAFGTPQLGISNPNQTSNVFGQKSFGTQPANPFGTAGTFNSTATTSSIFGRPATTNAASVFGGKPSFGSAPVFGGTPAAGPSIFGGSNKPAPTPFGAVQNAPTFGGLATQNTPLFGSSNTAQTAFGQTPAFGANPAQASSPFLKPQGAQGSVFGAASATPVQSGSVFGGSVAAPTTNSVFGAPAVSSAPTGIFGSSTTASAAFGGAPVFGGPVGFGAAQNTGGGSVFGGQSAFGGGPAVSSSSSVFGGTNSANSSFGALAQNTNTNAFGGANVAPGTNAFETAPNVAPFGAPISTAAGPFGTMSAPANSVFATSASPVTGAAPFGNAMTSYAQNPAFGFASPATNSTSAFGTTTSTSTTQSAFGTNTFGNAQGNTTMFGTTTVGTANPFTRAQQNSASPFGVANPFGNFAKPSTGFGVSVTVTLDETAYSPEESLTDDEKAIYRMKLFPEGQIPLRPPTKELK